MNFTELVLQGIRRFNAPKKLTFQPGFNLIWGAKSSGKSSLFEIFIDLLYPMPAEAARASFVSRESRNPATAPCRAGVGFRQGEVIYRNVMDYVAGQSSLSKLNPVNSNYEPLAQGTDAVHRAICELVRLPRPEVYRLLFCTAGGEFPSQKDSGSMSQASASLAAAGARDLSMSPDALAREIQALKKLHADALKIKELQYELDGIHKETFELTDIMKRASDLEQKRDAVKQESAGLPQLPELPPDLDERVDAYDKSVKRHDHEAPDLEQELHQLKADLDVTQVMKLQSDGKFIAGLVLLFLPIVLGVVTVSEERILDAIPITVFRGALLLFALAGIGWIATRLSAYIASQDALTGLQKDIKAKSEKLRQIERKFEVETSVVRTIMRGLAVDSTDEMTSTIQKIKDAQKRLEDLEQALQGAQGKPEYIQAAQRVPENKSRAAKIEQDLQLLSNTPLDPAKLADQIRGLEQQARQAGAAPMPAAATPGADQWSSSLPPELIEAIGRDTIQHPTHRLIGLAAHHLKVPMDQLIAKIIAPLDKNLAAISMNNLAESKIDRDGTFSIVDQEIKARTRFEQLEPFKQDVLYFALKFTLLQFILRELQLPVLFDSVLAHQDDRLHQILMKAIKFLSQQSQVIFLTDKELYAQAAESVQRL